MSQKMLLNISGLLNTGSSGRNDACIKALFRLVPRPAGAGCPLLVIAVAVVKFFMTVLLKKRTSGASFSETPPPSCVDTLFTKKLL